MTCAVERGSQVPLALPGNVSMVPVWLLSFGRRIWWVSHVQLPLTMRPGFGQEVPAVLNIMCEIERINLPVKN